MHKHVQVLKSMQGTSSDFSNINSDTKTWSPQPIIPVEVFLCSAEVICTKLKAKLDKQIQKILFRREKTMLEHY